MRVEEGDRRRRRGGGGGRRRGEEEGGAAAKGTTGASAPVTVSERSLTPDLPLAPSFSLPVARASERRGRRGRMLARGRPGTVRTAPIILFSLPVPLARPAARSRLTSHSDSSRALPLPRSFANGPLALARLFFLLTHLLLLLPAISAPNYTRKRARRTQAPCALIAVVNCCGLASLLSQSALGRSDFRAAHSAREGRAGPIRRLAVAGVATRGPEPPPRAVPGSAPAARWLHQQRPAAGPACSLESAAAERASSRRLSAARESRAPSPSVGPPRCRLAPPRRAAAVAPEHPPAAVSPQRARGHAAAGAGRRPARAGAARRRALLRGADRGGRGSRRLLQPDAAERVAELADGAAGRAAAGRPAAARARGRHGAQPPGAGDVRDAAAAARERSGRGGRDARRAAEPAAGAAAAAAEAGEPGGRGAVAAGVRGRRRRRPRAAGGGGDRRLSERQLRRLRHRARAAAAEDSRGESVGALEFDGVAVGACSDADGFGRGGIVQLRGAGDLDLRRDVRIVTVEGVSGLEAEEAVHLQVL